jgi:hypothetical protein
VLEFGDDGGPPYRVRWGSDGGHETLFFPGPDATVHHGTQATGGGVLCERSTGYAGRA